MYICIYVHTSNVHINFLFKITVVNWKELRIAGKTIGRFYSHTPCVTSRLFAWAMIMKYRSGWGKG